MKFKVGDTVITKHDVDEWFGYFPTGQVGTIIEAYEETFVSFEHYVVEFDDKQVRWISPINLELAQPYLNEQKMKALLGVE